MTKPLFKYLVFEGGGPAGLLSYGAAKYLAQHQVWRLADIQGMYATSIGAFMAVVMALDYDWQWLDDYFIKRPWPKLVHPLTERMLNAFHTRGLLDEGFIYQALEPLFKGKDLPMTCTLQEFYERTRIDVHMITADLHSDTIVKVDLSCKTHPHLPVVSALAMSMAYPILFQPVLHEGHCYVDGGVIDNFPLSTCLEQTGCTEDDILAFAFVRSDNRHTVDASASLLHYLYTLTSKLIQTVVPVVTPPKYTVRCLLDELEQSAGWAQAFSHEEARKTLITKGEKHAKLFKDYLIPTRRN